MSNFKGGLFLFLLVVPAFSPVFAASRFNFVKILRGVRDQEQPISLEKIFKGDYENESQAFDYLMKRLETEDDDAIKAWIYFALAELYEDIGDIGEAFHYAKKAKNLDDVSGDIKRLHKKLDDRLHHRYPWPVRFRVYNKKKKMDFSLSVGLKYDTNVILEEVNPLKQSDKKDTGRQLRFSLSKKWFAQPLSISQRTIYNFFQTDYFEHEQLDVGGHSLSQIAIRNGKLPGGIVSVLGQITYTYFLNAGDKLLWSMGGGPGIFFFHTRWSMLWQLLTSTQKTTYFSDALIAQGGDNYQIDFSTTKFLGKKENRSFNIGYSFISEEPDQATLRYDENRISLSYKHRFSKEKIPELKLSIRKSTRTYTTPQIGQPLRDDDQVSLMLNLKKQLFKFQDLEFTGTWLDNDSSVNLNRYEKQTLELMYRIRF